MRILKFKEPSISFPPEKVFVHTCVLSRSAESDSLRHHGLQPARFLCPWNFPGKNMEVGCHFLLQGFSLPRSQTNVSSVSRQILYHWATWEASRCSATPNESKVIGYGMVFEVTSATVDLHSFPMTGVPSGVKLCTVRGWEQSWFSVCWADTLCKRFCQFWKRKLGTGLGTQLCLLRFCAL